MKPRQLIQVEWEDPTVEDGWQIPEYAKTTMPARIHSAGYFINKDKHYFRLAAEIDDDGKFAQVLALPKGCIISIKALTPFQP